MNYSFETKVLFCRKLLRPKRQYYFMTCTDKPVCVVGNRLVTLNELFGLIIDLYPKKINHLIRWQDHLGIELRNFKWQEKTH